ncbi:MAG: Protein fixW [Verrucomicrobiota bacterium]|jgi:thiol-disulfide isomerase/thioredoxin
MNALFSLLLLASLAVAAQGDKPAPQPEVRTEPEAGNPASLKIGSPAPAIKFSKFYKGAPIDKIDPAQVYLVECWATWCPPCLASIPHLSEIAKKTEGKVTVLGVNVWERLEAAKVQEFVDRQGDKMGYRVASDSDGHFAKHWLAASDEEGIPCAFLVVQGKIAWIGLPADLDADTLLGIAEGRITAAQLAKMAAARESEMNLIEQEYGSKIQPLLEGGDLKGALAAIKRLADAHPKAGLERLAENLQAKIDAQENPGALLDKIAKLPVDGDSDELFELLGSLVTTHDLAPAVSDRLLAEIDRRIAQSGKDIPASADDSYPFIILRFMKADVLAAKDRKTEAVQILRDLLSQLKGEAAQAAADEIARRIAELQAVAPAKP